MDGILVLGNRAGSHRLAVVLADLATTWEEDPTAFLDQLPRSGIGIVMWSEAGGASQVLRQLRGSLWSAHVVVVADLSPSSLRALLDLGVTPGRVVWTEELADESPLARLTARLSDDPLMGLVEEFGNDRVIAPVLGTALKLLCHGRPPPCSVVDLSRVASVPERTLRHHWRDALGDIPPKRLVDWVVLLRALEESERRGWGYTAAWLGLDERTLDRIAVRLLGRHARDRQLTLTVARTAFREWTRSGRAG